jgi:hypothetical protein
VKAYAVQVTTAFDQSRERFETILAWLSGPESAGLTHAELEDHLQVASREVFCQLLQDHLDLRAQQEPKLAGVVGADQVARHTIEAGRARTLATVFGDVRVERLAYRARAHADLHPADAALNLPQEQHSHGLRRLAAVEATRGSFAEAAWSVAQATGQRLGNRQVEQLAQRAAVDFDEFYATRSPPLCQAGDVLVLSCDGKGMVMRPAALRPATAKAATSRKLATRLSKGEQRHRKRLAEVGRGLRLRPGPQNPRRGPARTRPAPPTRPQRPTGAGQVAGGQRHRRRRPGDRPGLRRSHPSRPRPAPHLGRAGRRQQPPTRPGPRRSPGPQGAGDHRGRLRARAGVPLAGRLVLFRRGRPPRRDLGPRPRPLGPGRPRQRGGAAIRRKATRNHLDAATRKPADTAAAYLLNKKPYLDYPTALARGWPIATGVIEGACRHLVNDRMDRTGARWSLTGAEAILKLRALRSNGDFDAYWAFHLAQERQRVHAARYAKGIIPHG